MEWLARTIPHLHVELNEQKEAADVIWSRPARGLGVESAEGVARTAHLKTWRARKYT
jgi:hypothetical protein